MSCHVLLVYRIGTERLASKRGRTLRLRDWQKTGVLAVASFALVFGGAEILARLWWEPGSYRPVIRADPVYGWALDPGSSLHAVDSDRHLDYHIQVNALGMRDPERPRDKPSGVRRVLLLGDSMVFGTGVEMGSRCGDILETRLGPGVEVLNAAVGGWGTDQEFLFLCREGFALQPDVVVLALCLSNDVANNMLTHELFGTAAKPRFFLQGNELEWNPPALSTAPGARPLHFLKRSRLLHFAGRHVRLLESRRRPVPPAAALPYHADDLESDRSHWAVFKRQYSPRFESAFQVTEALISAIRDSCAARGTPLVLFAFPLKFEVEPAARARELEYYGYDVTWFDHRAPYARLQRLAAQLGVPFVHPVDEFITAAARQPLFFDLDGHPDAAGHAVAAATLEEPVRQALGNAATHARR